MKDLKELKDEVGSVAALLADPEPGLFTWCAAVCYRWRRIVDLWESSGNAQFIGSAGLLKAANDAPIGKAADHFPVFLILWCDCTDGGSMGKTVRAFTTQEARDTAYATEYGSHPHLTGLTKADVQVNGPKWTDDYNREMSS